ncbi:hypothetical protein K438DRAFT_1782591 [Mycena galopus ATCC 62051]|nr:hypothetical protein K438DRAFT_1782591 [Mycena galopus ATCC 62051]
MTTINCWRWTLGSCYSRRAAHRISLEAFMKRLEEEHPEEVQMWRASVEKWYEVQHLTAEGSPFKLQDEVTTLHDIQSQIAAEELICTGKGQEIEREHIPGTFVTTGLEIEDVQRRLAVDVRAVKDTSSAQKLGFTKRCMALLKEIHWFRTIQRVYMPLLWGTFSDAQKEVFDGNGNEVPEAMRLFMPSEIPDGWRREEVCVLGLPDIEARMREGEATEALEVVRHGLRKRTMTNRYKLRNYTGQGMMTKGQGILCVINIRIHIAKVRDRHGDGEEWLCVLHDDNVDALNNHGLTNEEKAQSEHWARIAGAFVEGGIARAVGVARGEGLMNIVFRIIPFMLV